MPPRVTKNSRTRIALPEDDDALVRLPTVLGVFPVGETTWWNGIKAGKYPRPIRISSRVNAWKVGSIRKLLAAANDDAA
jgi:predicted DNA-binding transcriptional regulator AlpA